MATYTSPVAHAPRGQSARVSRTPCSAQTSCLRPHGPSDDAAAPPHQGDAAIVEGPAEFGGRLSQQHEALGVRDDLGGVEGLGDDTEARAAISKAAPGRTQRSAEPRTSWASPPPPEASVNPPRPPTRLPGTDSHRQGQAHLADVLQERLLVPGELGLVRTLQRFAGLNPLVLQRG